MPPFINCSYCSFFSTLLISLLWPSLSHSLHGKLFFLWAYIQLGLCTDKKGICVLWLCSEMLLPGIRMLGNTVNTQTSRSLLDSPAIGGFQMEKWALNGNKCLARTPAWGPGGHSLGVRGRGCPKALLYPETFRRHPRGRTWFLHSWIVRNGDWLLSCSALMARA